MIAETVGPGLHPTALLATHTAPLPEPGRRGQDCPGAAPGRRFAWTPSQILPGGRQGGGERAWGSTSAGGRSASQSTRRPSCIPAWPLLARTPAVPAPGQGSLSYRPAASRSPAPSSAATGDNHPVPRHQQSPHEGSPWVATDHRAGSCPSPPCGTWPLVVPGTAMLQTTSAAARDHHGTLQGAVMTGASLPCPAPSCTNALLRRLVPWFSEDCKGTDSLALTKAEP